MFLDGTIIGPTVDGYIVMVKGNNYKNIVAACHPGSNLILLFIKTIINDTYVSCTVATINQTQKVMIYEKLKHLLSNVDNSIFRLNIVLAYFLTDETISITQCNRTFAMANNPITIKVNNFRSSLLLSCIVAL